MTKSNLHLYQAEFSCPQCGAPAILDETESVINCSFCRTNVLLSPDKYFQYYFPASGSEELVYIPYWRLRGSYYRIHNPDGKIEILTKFIDSTVLAVSMPHLPFSLGIRTQNLMLKPVTEDMTARLLAPEIPLEKVRGKITKMQVSTNHLNRTFSEMRERSREHLAALDTSNVNEYEYFTNFNACLDTEAEIVDLLGKAALDLFQKGRKSKRNLELELVKLEKKNESVKEVNFQEFIGEIISLIYFPVYLRHEVLYDGILDEPLSQKVSPDTAYHDKPANKPKKTWKTIPLNCPGCGWSLSGKSDSILFHCENCETQWLFHDKQLRKCSIYHAPSDAKNVFYLPYWKLKIKSAGFEENIYKNQIKRSFIWRGDSDKNLSFETDIWTPALRLLPDEFLSAAVRLNSHAAGLKLKQSYPDSCKLFPVTLPISEAIESLNLIIYEMTGNKCSLAPHLPDLTFDTIQARVVFIPFEKQGIDLVQPTAQFAIRHAAIRDRTRIDDILS